MRRRCSARTGARIQSDTVYFAKCYKYSFRDVAQLVARLLWEQDVAGSNPVIPTKKGKRLFLLPFLLGFQASMYATHTRILFAARGYVGADCSVNTTGNENLLARQYSFGMHSKNEK